VVLFAEETVDKEQLRLLTFNQLLRVVGGLATSQGTVDGQFRVTWQLNQSWVDRLWLSSLWIRPAAADSAYVFNFVDNVDAHFFRIQTSSLSTAGCRSAIEMKILMAFNEVTTGVSELAYEPSAPIRRCFVVPDPDDRSGWQRANLMFVIQFVERLIQFGVFT